jgi:hypothetical protein
MIGICQLKTRYEKTNPSPCNSVSNLVIGDFGADLCHNADTFMSHSDATIVIMDICPTYSRMRGLDENLMSRECWPSDGFGNNRTIGSASESFECDRHRS